MCIRDSPHLPQFQFISGSDSLYRQAEDIGKHSYRMLYRRKYKTTLIFTRTYSRSLSYSSGSHIQLDQACRRQKCLYHSHLWIPADKSSNWGRWKRVRFRKPCQWLLSNRTGVEKYQRTLQQAPRVLWDSIEKRSRNDYPFQISCIIFYQYFLNKSHHKTD